MVTFKILGDPKAQKRPRAYRAGNSIRMYDPDAQDKKDFLLMIQDYAPKEPYESAVFVNLTFGFTRPKSHFGTGKNEGRLKDSAPIHHTKKPDIDNLRKFVMDAMSGLYFRDDSQVVTGSTTKVYSCQPFTEVSIGEVR